jgi:integrase/recombinase XerD
LTYGQVAQLMKLPLLSDPLGLRDRALLETAYGSALRPSEVGRLLLADIRLAEGELVVRTPKNRLERIVPLTTAASVFLHRYLQDVRPLWLSPLTHGALWLNPSGHPLPISSFTRKRLRHTHRAPELLGTPFTLHHLRHSCATHLLQNGADLMAIRALLGHVSLESTSYYTFWTALELKKIQHRCHPRGK